MPSSNRTIPFFPIRPGSTGTATVSRRPALPCLTVEPRSRTGSSPRAELPGPSSLPRDIRPAESCKIVSHKFMPAISPMSRGDSPLGHPVQLLTISAWLLVIPSGRARETICHHEASSVQTKPERPGRISAGRARETIRHHEASCRPVQIHSARPYPGRPHSRDYLSPRGELPSGPVLSWSGPAEPLVGGHPGRPRSRDYLSPRGELPSSSRSTRPGRIPAGRARETIRHHEASCRPIQILSARQYLGRPHSRDYLSPRGEPLSHSRISHTVFNLELDCRHSTQACSSSSRRGPPGSSLLPPDAPPLIFEFAPSKHHPRSPFSQGSSPPAHRLESQGYPGAPNQTRISPLTPTLAEQPGPAARVLSYALRAADRGS